MHKKGLRWLRLALIAVFLTGGLGLLPIFGAAQGLLETPQPGSFQSGVGLVRGWVCSAGRVDIEVDGRTSVQAVYGEPRGDTQAACGDTNNGFSVQVNWNELGEGIHTIRALADGSEFGRAQVVVATLGQTYLQGAQGEFVVQPFPSNGQQTRIQWQETRQLFVLSNGGTPASGGGSPRADAKLEDPQPGSFQSGIGPVRGWVCAASRVDIELDGRITVPAVYGEPRGDTQAACGDSNNGFSLQMNWNEVGDGAHTVRALADGVDVGSATFTVVTLGLGSFPTGLAGNFTVANFPRTGMQTQVQWQESQQNFVITGARFPGIDEGLCATKRGLAGDGSGGAAEVAWGNPCLLSGNTAVLRVQTQNTAPLLDGSDSREERAAEGGAFFLCASKLTIQQGGKTFALKDFLLVDTAGNEVCRNISPGSVIDLLLQVNALAELNFNAPFTVLYNGQPVVDFPGTPVPGTPKVEVPITELNFLPNSATALRAESSLTLQGTDTRSDGETRTQVGACQEQDFTITNSGGGTLLGGMTLIANGSGGNVFSIVSGGDINLGTGLTQTTTVRFCPLSTESVTGAIRISTNGGVRTILLQAGELPDVTASTTSIDFGTIFITETADRSFQVINGGGGRLVGTADIVSGSPFSVISGGTFNLEAGEEQTITIRLAPNSTGPVNDRVTLNTNGGSFTVLLGGFVIGSSPPNCDDGNLCTGDSVNTNNTCDNTPKVCPAGQACNGANGFCEPTSCDDGNLCTTDSVDPATHTCVHPSKVCPAGQSCVVTRGVCEAPPNCDDGNLCTDDSVNANNTCDHTLKVCPAGQSCNGDTGECDEMPS